MGLSLYPDLKSAAFFQALPTRFHRKVSKLAVFKNCGYLSNQIHYPDPLHIYFTLPSLLYAQTLPPNTARA